jgi:hypothetical protein
LGWGVGGRGTYAAIPNGSVEMRPPPYSLAPSSAANRRFDAALRLIKFCDYLLKHLTKHAFYIIIKAKLEEKMIAVNALVLFLFVTTLVSIFKYPGMAKIKIFNFLIFLVILVIIFNILGNDQNLKIGLSIVIGLGYIFFVNKESITLFFVIGGLNNMKIEKILNGNKIYKPYASVELIGKEYVKFSQSFWDWIKGNRKKIDFNKREYYASFDLDKEVYGPFSLNEICTWVQYIKNNLKTIEGGMSTYNKSEHHFYIKHNKNDNCINICLRRWIRDTHKPILYLHEGLEIQKNDGKYFIKYKDIYSTPVL